MLCDRRTPYVRGGLFGRLVVAFCSLHRQPLSVVTTTPSDAKIWRGISSSTAKTLVRTSDRTANNMEKKSVTARVSTHGAFVSKSKAHRVRRTLAATDPLVSSNSPRNDWKYVEACI